MAGRIPRPGGWKEFFNQSFPWDVGIAILGVLVVLNANKAFGEADSKWLGILFGAAIGLTTVGKLVVLRRRSLKAEANALECALHAIHEILISTWDEDEDPKLRLTVHVPLPDGNDLEQVIDYVGDQRKENTRGRRFAAQSGVIGEALREKEISFGTRENDDFAKYVQELISKWSYTEKDAKALDQESKSWMAIPLADSSGEVIGVVFFDAAVPKFFDRKIRRDQATYACAGLAKYVIAKFGSQS